MLTDQKLPPIAVRPKQPTNQQCLETTNLQTVDIDVHMEEGEIEQVPVVLDQHPEWKIGCKAHSGGPMLSYYDINGSSTMNVARNELTLGPQLKVMIVMRGVPGSGKSTRAKQILNEEFNGSGNKNYVV